MAYVRKRTTKAGSVSTTLVESYRDESGRPRQRVLANLHGEPDLLRALAKLAVMHDVLSKQLEEEQAESSKEGAGFVLVTERALTEYNHRIVQIDRQLAAIERDVAAINEHCTASDDEFQEAAQRYRREYCEAFERAMGLAMARRDADAVLRRMGK
jgi:hypothetical protein